MTNVLFIVGSLREGSFNQQLARHAEQLLADKATVSYLDWSQVPVFSQDLEADMPASVIAARQAVQAADAIWVFSPIYSYAIPGPVKNLLDWLSRAVDLSDTRGPSAIHQKVTTVSLLAASGHDETKAAYHALFDFLRTRFVDEVTYAKINSSAWGDGQFIPTDEAIKDLEKQAAALLAAVTD